ncbi:MAG TPA: hypothetical protein VF179_20585 [Thermoanaerobaculia bacterium]|nr:hypothetical protein [Thermoanaerobaculia bacterium]
MKRHAIALFALPLLAACASAPSPAPRVQAGYAAKPDFAKVEHDHPLTPAERAAFTPESLVKLSQEDLDQLYARLTAGPIPDGPFQGTVIFASGGGLRRVKEILGGVKGFLADRAVDDLEELAEGLWKGKVFYRDKMELRNQITNRKKLARLFKADLAKMRTATIDGREVGLLFPAKLYCGQSLLDSRRESVIIDYFFSDEIDGYLDEIDQIGGRNGLQIRDEIRMVRPGFYLGRAYVGKIFLLNFTLYNPNATEPRGEDCRPGSQQVAETMGS